MCQEFFYKIIEYNYSFTSAATCILMILSGSVTEPLFAWSPFLILSTNSKVGGREGSPFKSNWPITKDGRLNPSGKRFRTIRLQISVSRPPIPNEAGIPF